MRIVVGMFAILSLVIGGFFLLPDAPDNESVEAARTWQSVESDIAQGATLLDVRTLEEFNESHVQGSQLLPLQDIQDGTYPTAAKDLKIYLYCRSGNRSSEAKLLLVKAGFTNIIDLGGLTEVTALGAPLTK